MNVRHEWACFEVAVKKTAIPLLAPLPNVNIPQDLSDLFQEMATDFPAMLRENLVGVYSPLLMSALPALKRRYRKMRTAFS